MSWAERFEEEEDWQGVLDDYFRQWYTIQVNPAGSTDRIFIHGAKAGAAGNVTTEYLVDYKIDDNISKTDHVYLELYKDKDRSKFGWAYTTGAEMVVYLAVPDTIYMFEPPAIWKAAWCWAKQHRQVLTKRGSSGILVPVEEFAKVCTAVRRLD